MLIEVLEFIEALELIKVRLSRRLSVGAFTRPQEDKARIKSLRVNTGRGED